MDQVFYVLAIMGCGDESAACRQERVEPVSYTSYVACQEAMPAALQRNSDLAYPVISAACQRQGERMVDREAPRMRRGG